MPDLYDQIMEVAKEFMGAAAEEYMKRRARVSLGLEDSRQIGPEHLSRLADGVGITAEAYISKERAQQFKQAILKLEKGGLTR